MLAIIIIGFVAGVRLPGNFPVGLAALLRRHARSPGSAGSWSVAAVSDAAEQIAVGLPSLNFDLLLDGLEGISPLLATAIPLGHLQLHRGDEQRGERGRGGRLLRAARRAARRRDRRRRRLLRSAARSRPRSTSASPAGRRPAGGISYSLATGVADLRCSACSGCSRCSTRSCRSRRSCRCCSTSASSSAPRPSARCPKAHYAAIVLAIVPNVAAWATGLVDNALAAAGTSAARGRRRRARPAPASSTTGLHQARRGRGAGRHGARRDRGLHDRPALPAGRPATRSSARPSPSIGLIHGAEVAVLRRPGDRARLRLLRRSSASPSTPLKRARARAPTRPTRSTSRTPRRRRPARCRSARTGEPSDAGPERPQGARVTRGAALLAALQVAAARPGGGRRARPTPRARTAERPAWISLVDRDELLRAAPALRGGRATCRCSACRSRSRTTSTSRACRPPPPARRSPTCPSAARTAVRAADGGRRAADRQDEPGPVRDRASSGRARPYGACASVARPAPRLGRLELGLGGRGRRRRRPARARHRHRRLGPRAGRVQRRSSASSRRAGWSARAGVVPACRVAGLRVGVLAPTSSGGRRALAVAGRPGSATTPYSRARAGAAGARRPARPLRDRRPGRRRSLTCEPAAAEAWRRARRRARRTSADALVEIDLDPFLEAGRLLYGGPWVAERYAVAGEIARAPAARASTPSCATIVLGGARLDARSRPSAALEHARRAADARPRDLGGGRRAARSPTAPFHPTHAEVAADPIGVNARLGTFTNVREPARPVRGRRPGRRCAPTACPSASRSSRPAFARRARCSTSPRAGPRGGRGRRRRSWSCGAHLRGHAAQPPAARARRALRARRPPPRPATGSYALPGGRAAPARGSSAATGDGRPDRGRGLAARRRRARAARGGGAGAAGDRDRRARRRQRARRASCASPTRPRSAEDITACGGWRAYCEGAVA